MLVELNANSHTCTLASLFRLKVRGPACQGLRPPSSSSTHWATTIRLTNIEVSLVLWALVTVFRYIPVLPLNHVAVSFTRIWGGEV